MKGHLFLIVTHEVEVFACGLGGEILKGNAPFFSGLGALTSRLVALEPHFGHTGESELSETISSN